jgi:hypothetical protein
MRRGCAGARAARGAGYVLCRNVSQNGNFVLSKDVKESWDSLIGKPTVPRELMGVLPGRVIRYATRNTVKQAT